MLLAPTLLAIVSLPLALFLTMTVCGIWHGAGWNFVLWGMLQGLLLVAWRVPWSRDTGRLRWRDAPAIVVFFHLFALTLVVFRCENLAQAGSFFERLFVGNALPGWPVLESAVVVLCVALHGAERAWRENGDALARRLANSAWGPCAEALVLGLVVGVAILAAGAGGEFIYFQF